MWIKEKVKQLQQRYQTSCPYQIAEHLKIHVLHHDLHPEIRGFYKYDRRNRYIVINNNLDETYQRVVCAHELGHAILHSRANTPFMRKNTLFSIDKLEREANTFAAELLIPDDALYCCEQPTSYDISARYEVPVELVKLKFK